MFCLVALIVFSILGIFSATHRKLAKEAFNCVLRRVTLRSCDTNFDEKMKGKIVGKLLTRSAKSAKFVRKYWEAISWVLVILFFTSLFFSVRSIYNLAVYKSCNPQNPKNCIFIQKDCSLLEHCQPCDCKEETCTFPDYTSCGGEENCNCPESCEN